MRLICYLLPALLLSVVPTAHAGWLSDLTKNIGRQTIQPGKTIEQSVQDTAKGIEKRPPSTEHSPSDPCANNPQLPQCVDLKRDTR